MSYLCAAVCSRARWSGSLSPHSQGAGCLQGPVTHAAQPSCTSKQHCSGKNEQALTGRRGAMGVGRKGPVHLNSGMVVLRALPRCVQKSQDSGPGLCARLCSGQACCTRKYTGCLAGLQDGNRPLCSTAGTGCTARVQSTLPTAAGTGQVCELTTYLEAVLGAEHAGLLGELHLQALWALQLCSLAAPVRRRRAQTRKVAHEEGWRQRFLTGARRQYAVKAAPRTWQLASFRVAIFLCHARARLPPAPGYSASIKQCHYDFAFKC